jgi:hypothetical protein
MGRNNHIEQSGSRWVVSILREILLNFNPFDDAYTTMKCRLLSACRERDRQIEAIDRFKHFDPRDLLLVRQIERQLEDRHMRATREASRFDAVIEMSEVNASAGWNTSWSSGEVEEIDAEAKACLFISARLDASSKETYVALRAISERRSKLEREFAAILSFDERLAQANVRNLNLEIAQLEAEVRKIACDKQRIDELIGEHVAALNVARDRIGFLNRSISEANDLQRQLASAQSAYERKCVHEQCESKFKMGYPLDIVRECRWSLTRLTSDVKQIERRIQSIVKRAVMQIEHVVIDGNNFCYEQTRFIGLAALLAAVKAIAQKHAVTVIFDSSIRCHIKKSNREIRRLFPDEVNVSVVPRRTKADETALTIAGRTGYYVVSNSRFAGFRDMPVVRDNRVLRHQIMDGRVMIFDLNVDIALGDTFRGEYAVELESISPFVHES